MEPVRIIGDAPLAVHPSGALKAHIGTYFVGTRTLVTLPGLPHALQQIKYRALLEAERKAAGKPFPEEEWEEISSSAVDLIMRDRDVMIRPDPAHMPLAFEADEALQALVPKHHICFLHAQMPQVRQAIRERGENWRISPEPRYRATVIMFIKHSLVAIGGLPVYYYNVATGVRYLTVERFLSLGTLPDDSLRIHLAEIRDYSQRRNKAYYPEIDFFAADAGRFGKADFAGKAFEGMDGAALRAAFKELCGAFARAVPEELREDNLDDAAWRNKMFVSLSDDLRGVQSDDMTQGLTPEFFRQVFWLPGGRIERGALVFDSIFTYAKSHPEYEAELSRLCDRRVQGMLCNCIREFDRIRYINVGGLLPDLRQHPPVGGHRAYLLEVMCEGSDEPVRRILRIQRWGIREHLDEGHDLLWATTAATEYTQYTLNRRLGCWELGMPLPGRLDTDMIYETYDGSQKKYAGTPIWTTYFSRELIHGIASDKIPDEKLRSPAFATALARLLGEVAAPNLVVGRVDVPQMEVKFDSGDEMLILGPDGLPQKLVVSDHAGTFVDVESPMGAFAAGYARPVVSRWARLADPAAFRDAYLGAFEKGLLRLQRMCPSREHVFDALFQYTKKAEGTFEDRWHKALARLERMDVAEFIGAVRGAVEKGIVAR
jgi:hypothetical protein